ncbi:hypothetical protein [Paenibacillus sp. NPDC093718]|uniref:hypothetical protein n=1 Tax=Paenibacillus sp. NPDC093718 TaxID=3390601 RepID=UPI003CFD9823
MERKGKISDRGSVAEEGDFGTVQGDKNAGKEESKLMDHISGLRGVHKIIEQIFRGLDQEREQMHQQHQRLKDQARATTA